MMLRLPSICNIKGEVILPLIEFPWHLLPILEEKTCRTAAIKILPGHPESPATGAWTQRGWPAIGVTMESHGPSYRTPSCWAVGRWNRAKIRLQKSPNNTWVFGQIWYALGIQLILTAPWLKILKPHGATPLPKCHEMPCDIFNVFAAWSHGLEGTGSLIWHAERDP